MFHFVTSLVCICYLVTYIKAINPIEELKIKYVNYIMECSKQYPITQEDIEMLRHRQLPNNKPVKCVFACAYKKVGIMNDKGELSVQKVYDISAEYLINDPSKLLKARQFADACQSVNAVDVGEEDKDCERAALIFKCSVEKAPQFDFIV